MTAARLILYVTFLVLVCWLEQSHAALITVFNTGVDANGNVLASGSADPHWDVILSADQGFVAPGDAIVQQANPNWIANDTVGTPVPVGYLWWTRGLPASPLDFMSSRRRSI